MNIGAEMGSTQEQGTPGLVIAAGVGNAVLTAAFWINYLVIATDPTPIFSSIWVLATPLIGLFALYASRRTRSKRWLWLNLGPIVVWAVAVAALVKLFVLG